MKNSFRNSGSLETLTLPFLLRSKAFNVLLSTFIFFRSPHGDLQSFCIIPGFEFLSPLIRNCANLIKIRLRTFWYNPKKWHKQSICLSVTEFTQTTSDLTNTFIVKKHRIALKHTKMKIGRSSELWRHLASERKYTSCASKVSQCCRIF